MAPTQSRLKELFQYTEDGFFVRLSTGKKVSCNLSDSHRYARVSVDGRSYFLHRCIFVYHHGYLPNVVDHIDGDRANNRIENLRAVTQQQNCLNRVRHKNSKSPYKNVYWNKAANKWSVQVNINGKRKYLGVYDDIEYANLIAIEARNKYQGKFANHGGTL